VIRTASLGSNGHANQHKSLNSNTLTIPKLEKYSAKFANQAIIACRTRQKLPGRQQKSSGSLVGDRSSRRG
tara:strand:+ start:1547 stop:1759 length:213 start_codon:yes stop_codon:yes gene_type:complete